jgi:glycosyltransferase involved in cell wall biosynthesis
MRLTVAICTWNRAALLRQALGRMTQLTIPPEVEWELVVVNNNCTDDTDEVIRAFAPRLPIRPLFEPRPGHSNARNLAVREASGEYILWTDDDALVGEDWLSAYFRSFQRWPTATFFGGPVEPWFAAPPPRWLERAFSSLGPVWAMRDFGPHPVPLSTNRLPFGVNMAIRTLEQRQNPYDTRLGHRPGLPMACEETHLLRSLLADGHHGWWVPEARVLHYIPRDRMTTRYVRTVGFRYGAYLALTAPPWTGPRLFGKPRWVWRHVVNAEATYQLHRLFSTPEVWVRKLIDTGQAWGQLLSSRR